jgi:hypothetical protein
MSDFVKAAQEVVKGIDPATEKFVQTKEQLDTLMSMANIKKELMKTQVIDRIHHAGKGEDKTVPVASIEAFRNEVHGYISSDTEHLSKGITSSVKSLLGVISGQGAWDEIANASIAIGEEVLSTALNAFLGAGAGEEHEDDVYFIVLRGITLLRIDYQGWRRRLKAQAITEKIEGVSVFVSYRSVVDVLNTPIDQFRSSVQPLFVKKDPNLERDPIGLVKEIDKFYEALTAGQRSQPMAGMPIQQVQPMAAAMHATSLKVPLASELAGQIQDLTDQASQIDW